MPDSLVKLKWDGGAGQPRENLVARMVWATRWSLAQVLSIDPREVVKAGIYIEDEEQLPLVGKDTLAKEFKAALAAEAAPTVIGLSPDSANSPGEVCLSAV